MTAFSGGTEVAGLMKGKPSHLYSTVRNWTISHTGTTHNWFSRSAIPRGLAVPAAVLVFAEGGHGVHRIVGLDCVVLLLDDEDLLSFDLCTRWMKSDNGASLLRPPSGSVDDPATSRRPRPRTGVGLPEFAVTAELGPLEVDGLASDRDLASSDDDENISEALCGKVCPC